MSYTIKLTNGNVLAVIPDGTINTQTSVALFGKNYPDYGQFLDDNLVYLLENSANNTAPPRPLTGQLWWDSLNLILKVYNGAEFKNISSPYSGPTPPPAPVIGELWFNTTSETLNVYTGIAWLTVGPNLVKGTGVQASSIEDTSGVSHTVVEVLISSQLVGIISKDPSYTPLIGIPGYVTINPGYNMPSDIGGVPMYFQGTVTNALTLEGVSKAGFMSSLTNTSTAGNISIRNNGGLTIGAVGNFKFFNSSSDGIIENTSLTGNIVLNLNYGGTQTNVAVFYGSNGAIQVGNIYSNNAYANYYHGDGSNISNIQYSSLSGAYSNANAASFFASGQTNTSIQTTGFFIGDGSQLSNINAANLVNGYSNTNAAAYFASNTVMTNIATNAHFVGDGGQLSNINAANIVNNYSNANVSSYLSSGNVVANIETSGFFIGDGGFLSNISSYSNTNVTSLLASNTVTSNIQTSAYFIGDGSQLTGGYSDANVANYLPTYAGNLVSLTGSVITTSNVQANTVIANSIIVGNSFSSSSNSQTTSTTPTVIASIDIGSYNSFNFNITAATPSSNSCQALRIVAVTINDAVSSASYDIASLGNSVGTFNVSLSGSNMDLTVTPTSSDLTTYSISVSNFS